MTRCHRIDIPVDVKVPGFTAQGCPTTVLPGQYLVHELSGKLPFAERLCRIVGADASGRDVHVRREAVARYLMTAAPETNVHRCAEVM